MTEKDQQPEDGSDDFDKAARLNFRDYPSSSLVMIAALTSGLGWMLYRWIGRKRPGQGAVPDAGEEAEGKAPQTEPPADGSA
jgi:hypothetical protein